MDPWNPRGPVDLVSARDVLPTLEPSLPWNRGLFIRGASITVFQYSSDERRHLVRRAAMKQKPGSRLHIPMGYPWIYPGSLLLARRYSQAN